MLYRVQVLTLSLIIWLMVSVTILSCVLLRTVMVTYNHAMAIGHVSLPAEYVKEIYTHKTCLVALSWLT